jgi:hypothetical protein
MPWHRGDRPPNRARSPPPSLLKGRGKGKDLAGNRQGDQASFRTASGEPEAEKIVLIVRKTLITLNDAIQTGNLTVMRDKSAPGFRENHFASQIGQIFYGLARSGVDMAW